MTSAEAFRDALDRRGVKMAFVAQLLGITRQGLSVRLKRGADFRAWEMMEISDRLNLTGEEVKAIFYPESKHKAN